MASQAEIAQSILDPVAFQHIWLNRKLSPGQCELARAIYQHGQTAVKGCHASGKTFIAAGAVLQWLMAHKRCKILTTDPTRRQVEVFWREIYSAWDRSNLKKYLPEPLTTKLEMAADRFAFGATSSAGVNVQGLHGDDVLIVADEAPGIDADIWDAIEGIRAGGRVRVLKLGNPVVPSGEFYDAFNRSSAIHKCISISAFDCPNLQHPDGRPVTFEELLQMSDEELDYAPYPYLITRRWVKERYITWGPTHPKFLSRVMAKFPSQSPYSVFDLEWIERSKRDPTEAELKAAKGCAIQVGIDVAGAGADETTLCARVNGIILVQKAWPDADPRGPVVAELSRLAHHALYPLGAVVVDIVGIGYNFGLHLADQGLPVYGFQAGAKPLNGWLYANQKAEAYFTLRDVMKANLVSGMNDEECEAQLSTVLYHETSTGKTEIESKDEAAKRGVASPDRAEAVVMAFTKVVPRSSTVVASESLAVHISPY